ncbi:MAG: hypothetical protein WDO73_08560 [Ignavibacteriota bacterium]
MQQRNFVARVTDGVRSIPGVTQAGVASLLPFGGQNNDSVITIVGYNLGPGENPPVPFSNTVDAGYMETMGIPLLQGRGFSRSDTPDTRNASPSSTNIWRRNISPREMLSAHRSSWDCPPCIARRTIWSR